MNLGAVWSCVVAVTLLLCLASCLDGDSVVEVHVSPNDSIRVNSRSVTSNTELAVFLSRHVRRQKGIAICVIISSNTTHSVFAERILGASACAGVENIRVRVEGVERYTVYPTVLAWTNEWTWRNVLGREGNLATNHGHNVTIEAGNVFLNGKSSTWDVVEVEIVNASAKGRDKVSISADDTTLETEVLRVLHICERAKANALVTVSGKNRGQEQPTKESIGPAL